MIVNRLERGERGISLDDWFICAAALGVSPLALLPGEGAVQLAPHLTLPAGLVLAWMRGEGPLRRDDLAVYEANEPARFGFFSDNEQRYYATTSRGSSRDEKEGLLAFIAHERDMLEDMADTFRRVPGHPSGEQHIRDLRARVAAEIAELDELARKVEATTPHRPIPRKPRKKEGKK